MFCTLRSMFCNEDMYRIGTPDIYKYIVKENKKANKYLEINKEKKSVF